MVGEVKYCCGCVDLKRGCFILAYFRLIAIIVCSVIIIALTPVKPESADAKLELESINIYIVLADCILNTAFNIVFIVGLHKNYRKCVLAYIIYTGILIAFSCVEFIISLDKETSKQDVVIFLVILVLSFYFLAVIRSYYVKMNEPEMGPAVICKRDIVEA